MKRWSRTVLPAALLAGLSCPPLLAQDGDDPLDALFAGEAGSDAASPTPTPQPAPLETIPVGWEAAPPSPTARPVARVIEEIVVTARKREESLQDAPVAVSALSQEQLERYNVGDMTKIAEMTPQLFVSRGSNGNGGVITMRGIGSSSTTSGFDQAVSINVDGIQYSRANVLHQGYFDVGQVEVLKGPQSLFFGKSSSAGVISLNTADPGPEREGLLKFGNEFEAGERYIEGVLSGPLSERFGVRLAARHSRIGGYVQNTAQPALDAGGASMLPAPERDWPQEEQSMARLSLRYLGEAGLDAKLKLFWVDMENVGPTLSTEMVRCEATGTAQLSPGQECVGDWQVAQNGLPPDVAASEPIWNHRGGELYSFYKSYSAVLNLGLPLGSHSLSAVSGYYDFDNQYLGDYDFTETSAVGGAEHPVESAFSQELRLLSEYGGPLNFMLGAYYQHRQFDFGSVVRLLPLPQDPLSGRYTTWERSSATTTRAWSVFGQLIWAPGERWSVSAGARYSDEAKDSYSVHRYLHPAVIALFRPVGEPIEARTHDTNLSPELTLAWHASDDVMLYGAYKQGFKSGGYSNSAVLSMSTTAEQQVFAPETVGGFEAGIKATLAGGSLQLNATAYSYEFKDLQVNFFDAAAVNFLTQNAATATTRGVELDFRWLPPIDGLDLHGALSYNRAIYGDFISFCHTGQSQEDGCDMSDEQGRPVQDLGGSVRPIAPKYTANLGLLYELPVSRGLSLSFSTDASYVDDYLLNALAYPLYQDRYLRTDASIGLGHPDRRWQLALIGRNLGNEYIAYDGGDSPLSGQGTGNPEPAAIPADQLAVAGRPRELLLQFSLRFGGS